MKRKIKLGKYKHFKGGIYKVIGIAKHSETLEKLVIYKHDSQFWVRPLKMFLEKVTQDNKTIPRFTRFKYIGEKNEK